MEQRADCQQGQKLNRRTRETEREREREGKKSKRKVMARLKLRETRKKGKHKKRRGAQRRTRSRTLSPIHSLKVRPWLKHRERGAPSSQPGSCPHLPCLQPAKPPRNRVSPEQARYPSDTSSASRSQHRRKVTSRSRPGSWGLGANLEPGLLQGERPAVPYSALRGRSSGRGLQRGRLIGQARAEAAGGVELACWKR